MGSMAKWTTIMFHGSRSSLSETYTTVFRREFRTSGTVYWMMTYGSYWASLRELVRFLAASSTKDGTRSTCSPPTGWLMRSHPMNRFLPELVLDLNGIGFHCRSIPWSMFNMQRVCLKG